MSGTSYLSFAFKFGTNALYSSPFHFFGPFPLLQLCCSGDVTAHASILKRMPKTTPLLLHCGRWRVKERCHTQQESLQYFYPRQHHGGQFSSSKNLFVRQQQYNEIAAKGNKVNCEMKVVRGDMTTHLLLGKKISIEGPNRAFEGFDVVAMTVHPSLLPNLIYQLNTTHDSLARGRLLRRRNDSSNEPNEEIIRVLAAMINLLDGNGHLLIIDIEKCHDDHYFKDLKLYASGTPRDRLEFSGHRSKARAKALEEIRMEDITVIGH